MHLDAASEGNLCRVVGRSAVIGPPRQKVGFRYLAAKAKETDIFLLLVDRAERKVNIGL